MIEKRHPDFQGMMHAQTVGDSKNIFGQIGLSVTVKGPVEGVSFAFDIRRVKMFEDDLGSRRNVQRIVLSH